MSQGVLASTMNNEASFPATSEWNFCPSEGINSVYENAISPRFDVGRLGWSVRGWLRDPRTCLRPPATGGRHFLPCPYPSARPNPSAPASAGGTSAGHGRGGLSTPASASRGRCSASGAGAGLRLYRRILELEWRGLDLGSRGLDAASFPRGRVVWRPLGLSQRAARLGARPLALRLQWLE